MLSKIIIGITVVVFIISVILAIFCHFRDKIRDRNEQIYLDAWRKRHLPGDPKNSTL